MCVWYYNKYKTIVIFILLFLFKISALCKLYIYGAKR